MQEGANQGYPFSGLLTAIVLNHTLKPLMAELLERAKRLYLSGDMGDKGHGSIMHVLGWVDESTSVTPLVDTAYFCTRLGQPLVEVKLNGYKTRIQTSCDGKSIVKRPRAVIPELHAEVEQTL